MAKEKEEKGTKPPPKGMDDLSKGTNRSGLQVNSIPIKKHTAATTTMGSPTATLATLSLLLLFFDCGSLYPNTTFSLRSPSIPQSSSFQMGFMSPLGPYIAAFPHLPRTSWDCLCSPAHIPVSSPGTPNICSATVLLTQDTSSDSSRYSGLHHHGASSPTRQGDGAYPSYPEHGIGDTAATSGCCSPHSHSTYCTRSGGTDSHHSYNH